VTEAEGGRWLTHDDLRRQLLQLVHNGGPEHLAHACRLGAEGIVSKCRTAPYRPGRRTDEWRKTKCVRRGSS
jgi:bifunctional non-homologous end joining protein LigD